MNRAHKSLLRSPALPPQQRTRPTLRSTPHRPLTAFALTAGLLATALSTTEGRAQDVFLGHSRPTAMATGLLSSYAYFAASDGITGTELWRTNGTAGGAQRLTDLRAGRPDSAPRDIVVFPGDTEVYFTARDASNPNQRRLYRHQVGTTTTTVVGSLLQPTELVLGYSTSGPLLYLIARIGSGPMRVYSVSAGTVTPVPGSGAASSPYALTPVGTDLYFAGTHPTLGTELFRHQDGAATTTAIDVAPGPASSSPSRLTAFGNRLWFAANRNAAIGRELCSHGTSGLSIIDTWTAGNGAPDQLVAGPFALWFTSYNGTRRDLCFARLDNTWGRLPNPALTAIEEVTPVPIGDGCWFRGRSTAGTEPWSTPDTATNPTQVADIRIGGSSRPRHFQWTSAGMVYRADNGTTGAELYRGTTPIHNLRTSGTGHAHASRMVRIGMFGRYVYAADGDTPSNPAATEGRELWSWDGTTTPVRADNIKTGLGRQETTGVFHDLSDATNLVLEFSEFGAASPIVLFLSTAPAPPIGLPGVRGLLIAGGNALPLGNANAAGQFNLTVPKAVFAPSSVTWMMQGAGFGQLNPALMVTPPVSSQLSISAPIGTGPITVVRECMSLDDKTGEYRACLVRTDTNDQPAHIGLVRYSQPVPSGTVTRTLLEVRSIDPGQAIELEGQIDLDANETTGPQPDRIEIRVYSTPPSQGTVGTGAQVAISYC